MQDYYPEYLLPVKYNSLLSGVTKHSNQHRNHTRKLHDEVMSFKLVRSCISVCGLKLEHLAFGYHMKTGTPEKAHPISAFVGHG